jgi:hypothetical protein
MQLVAAMCKQLIRDLDLQPVQFGTEEALLYNSELDLWLEPGPLSIDIAPNDAVPYENFLDRKVDDDNRSAALRLFRADAAAAHKDTAAILNLETIVNLEDVPGAIMRVRTSLQTSLRTLFEAGLVGLLRHGGLCLSSWAHFQLVRAVRAVGTQTQTPSMSDASSSSGGGSFAPGAVVRLVGLAVARQLNGTMGTVCAERAARSDRVIVQTGSTGRGSRLAGSSQRLSVLPANLELATSAIQLFKRPPGLTSWVDPAKTCRPRVTELDVARGVHSEALLRLQRQVTDDDDDRVLTLALGDYQVDATTHGFTFFPRPITGKERLIFSYLYIFKVHMAPSKQIQVLEQLFAPELEDDEDLPALISARAASTAAGSDMALLEALIVHLGYIIVEKPIPERSEVLSYAPVTPPLARFARNELMLNRLCSMDANSLELFVGDVVSPELMNGFELVRGYNLLAEDLLTKVGPRGGNHRSYRFLFDDNAQRLLGAQRWSQRKAPRVGGGYGRLLRGPTLAAHNGTQNELV